MPWVGRAGAHLPAARGQIPAAPARPAHAQTAGAPGKSSSLRLRKEGGGRAISHPSDAGCSRKLLNLQLQQLKPCRQLLKCQTLAARLIYGENPRVQAWLQQPRSSPALPQGSRALLAGGCSPKARPRGASRKPGKEKIQKTFGDSLLPSPGRLASSVGQEEPRVLLPPRPKAEPSRFPLQFVFIAPGTKAARGISDQPRLGMRGKAPGWLF